MSQPMLLKYVRDSQNHKIGCVVAIDTDKLGWSLCCKMDRFDKKRAVKMALGRARAPKGFADPVPRSILNEFKFMSSRAKRYFHKDSFVKYPSRKKYDQAIRVKI